MKRTAFFYTLLTHLTFSMEMVDETSKIAPASYESFIKTEESLSIAADITTSNVKHTTQEITTMVNAAMYGGPLSNLIFESQATLYSYYVASMLKNGKSFQTIYRETANLRKHIADQSKTPKSELFNIERTPESIPWAGGATTGVLKYPSMRRNLVESLQHLTPTLEFLPLDESLEYRYISMNFKEWIPFLVQNNSEDNQLLTFFLRMVSGQREDGSEDSSMWYYEFEQITAENGLENEKKYFFSHFFKKKLYDFIDYHPSSEPLAPEAEYNIIRGLFIQKFTESSQAMHLKSVEDNSNEKNDEYKLSLVQVKFKDTNIYTRSVMFPTKTDDPFNYTDKPFGLIHPPTRSVEYHLGLCHQLFENARHFQGTPEQKILKILNFSYYWSLTMPFARGSAAVNEYLSTGLLVHHNIGYPKRSILQELDLYAQSIFTADQFKDKFKKLLDEPGSMQALPYVSVADYEKETLEKINANIQQQSEVKVEVQPLSSTIPLITYTDGLFVPCTAVAMNQIDELVNLLYATSDYYQILGTIVGKLSSILEQLKQPTAVMYKTLKGPIQTLDESKAAFKNAMIYENNDATTFAKIKEYQQIYNASQPFHAGGEIINDLLFFHGLCAYHNIVPRLFDESSLQRPLYKSRHVIASSEEKMNALESFISSMNPAGHGSELCEIMQHYNSDKSTVHSYTQLYDFLFRDIRETAQNVLEMGIGSVDPNFAYTMGANGTVGASLRGWRAYFTQAQIFGADIAEKELFEEERIKTFFANQLDIPSIQSMFKKTGVEKFDVIIDDGLHCFEANHTFLRVAIDHVKDGGLYIIEDIAPRGIEAFVSLLEKMELNAAFVQLPKHPGRFDNNMFIIFK